MNTGNIDAFPPLNNENLYTGTYNYPFKKWHRMISFTLLIPFIIISVSGGMYRILRAWFGISKTQIRWLLDVHVMSIIGLERCYPFIIGVGILFTIITGIPLIVFWLRSNKKNKISSRDIHRYIGIIITIPLTLTTLSGMIWTVARHFFNIDKKELKFLMKLHQFSFFTPSVFYIFLLLSGTIILLSTGFFLLDEQYNFKRMIKYKLGLSRYQPVDDGYESDSDY